jgi:hypothetical protein
MAHNFLFLNLVELFAKIISTTKLEATMSSVKWSYIDDNKQFTNIFVSFIGNVNDSKG